MSMNARISRKASRSRRRHYAGFSLIEMMVAIVLGLLLSAGIVTLFLNVGNTNRVQDALARLQENGRYAITRMDADLRMGSGQYCSNFAGASQQTANIPVVPARAPFMFAAAMTLPDSNGAMLFPSAAPISPRVFMQGYECGGGACIPALPAGFPAQGLADGDRLPGTDVLTVRYITGTGWPVSAAALPNCVSGGSITLAPLAGDDSPETATPASNKFAAGDLALLSNCQNPTILPVAGYAPPTVLTLGAMVPGGPGGSPFCGVSANRDTRVFNFSKDFVTVSYYIRLNTDLSPDAVPGRLIPSLVRRENAVEQELVQGVERLDFLYGVRDRSGALHFTTADLVDANSNAANCIDPPAGVPLEAGCLWRSVKSIEVHALIDNVNDTSAAVADTGYLYTIDGPWPPAPPVGAASPVTGMPWGRMMRREFTSLVEVRNGN